MFEQVVHAAAEQTDAAGWAVRRLGGRAGLEKLPLREEDSLDPDAPPTWMQPVHPEVVAEIMVLIDELAGQVRDALLLVGCEISSREEFGLKLGLEEALINAARHGNEGDPSKIVAVRWRIDALRRRFSVRIEDEGAGFTLALVPDCTAANRQDVPHGRGLLLMRRYFEVVDHPQEHNGAHVVMEKVFGQAEEPGLVA